MSRAYLDFVHDLTVDVPPSPVVHAARRAILDLTGIAAGGLDTPLSMIIRDHAANHFAAGNRKARLLFDGRSVSPAGAALAGGMTIDALDGHDGFNLAMGHAGCGVFPATLALSEAEGVDDAAAFLTAIVIGYEIACRAAVALHRTAADYHTSGAWVSLACAAIGARFMDLTAAQTREAVGIAEYHGPRSQMMRCIDHPTMVKDGSGWGAMAGVSAAYLAADGFTGAPAITIEDPSVADLWADLGDRWLILEQYYKPYPVCRWAQPPMQAVLNLKAAHGLTSTDVERIEIVTFHESVRLALKEPRNTEQAQYSTAYPTAAALVRGEVGVKEVTEEAFADPEIRRLSGSMVVREAETYNEKFPAERAAHVELILKSGERLVSPRTHADGDPDDLPDDAEVEAKFRTLMASKPAASADGIASAVWALDAGGSIETFRDLICRGLD